MANQANEKLAPLKQLTAEQQMLVSEAETFVQNHFLDKRPSVFVISGEAGTGKSVVLSQLYYDLQSAAKSPEGRLSGSTNYFIVNHPELLKVYRNIAGRLPNEYKKNFQRPTTLINQCRKNGTGFDVGIIDEAHLLLSQPDHYNNFYGDNQLVDLLKLCRVLIIVFDAHQVLRLKTYWTETRLKQVLAPYSQQWVTLHAQFRMHADNALIDWINTLTTSGRLDPITPSFSNHYDFRVFNDAEKMHQQIVARNNEVGLSRILSTTGYPSILDGGNHYIVEGNFSLPWDQYNYAATPWAELPESINEVGSIYTCQGFDLNYTGIILGPPVHLAPDGEHIMIDTTKITDPEAFKKRPDMQAEKDIHEAKMTLMLNAINVIMKRGVKGLYLYAHDVRLRNRLFQAYKLGGQQQ